MSLSPWRLDLNCLSCLSESTDSSHQSEGSSRSITFVLTTQEMGMTESKERREDILRKSSADECRARALTLGHIPCPVLCLSTGLAISKHLSIICWMERPTKVLQVTSSLPCLVLSNLCSSLELIGKVKFTLRYHEAKSFPLSGWWTFLFSKIGKLMSWKEHTWVVEPDCFTSALPTTYQPRDWWPCCVSVSPPADHG